MVATIRAPVLGWRSVSASHPVHTTAPTATTTAVTLRAEVPRRRFGSVNPRINHAAMAIGAATNHVDAAACASATSAAAAARPARPDWR